MLLYLHMPVCILKSDGMPTNLAIDDRLLEEARRIGRHRTKKETVNAALEEYIRRRKQLDVLALFGTIDYDAAYDYKKARHRGRRG
jgi:Arc/MetJ family transcription regulator